MHVGRIMHTELVTLPPDATMVEAKETIDEKQIEHILIVDKKGKLAGIVSDRDIKLSWASPATTFSTHELTYLLNKMTVDMIMSKKIITVPPEMTIERAALVMQENRISALPVMEKEQLVGIITRTDVMRILLEAIGVADDSQRLMVLVEDRIGSLAEITSILKEHLINIQSLFIWPAKDFKGIFHLVLRVAAADGDKAISALEAGGFKVMTRYVKDLTPYLPRA